jgi:hypothetical protein
MSAPALPRAHAFAHEVMCETGRAGRLMCAKMMMTSTCRVRSLQRKACSPLLSRIERAHALAHESMSASTNATSKQPWSLSQGPARGAP